eukprot:m.237977 g.237977  ORF g.237977 m.237977 type:complete len:773 (+) comp40153_c0_seq15:74-2392(+)
MSKVPQKHQTTRNKHKSKTAVRGPLSSGGTPAIGSGEKLERSDSKLSETTVKTTSKASMVARAFDRHVRPFIDLVDSLRSLGLDQDIDLPSVVVIGDQSSGKSSVLEAISGVQLPRGTGIVTRCALELRMQKMKVNPLSSRASLVEEGDIWKARLSKCGPDVPNGSAVEDIAASTNVGEAVSRAQDDLAGKGKNICVEDHILLEVVSPYVPDLTLIDLPGIARVAGEGQAEDIEEQTKGLIRKHIKKGETIILCVIPCNVDIATTEALKLAREFDPDGERTLGVMTKPDLVDRGAEKNIVEIATNQTGFKLRLGFTVVKCRGQKDINDGMTLKDSLKTEERFFKTHEHFQSLFHDGQTGIERLARKLTGQLVTQIKRSLPEIIRRVNDMHLSLGKKLHRLGEPVPANKRMHLITLLNDFGDVVKDSAKGSYGGDLNDEDKVYATAHRLFTRFLAKIRQTEPGLNDEQGYTKHIEAKIRSSRGQELPGFPSFGVFKSFAINFVQKIKKPAEDLVEDVHRKVLKIVFSLADNRFDRFPDLLERVRDKVSNYLGDQKKRALEDIKTTFEKECWVFTQDANFSGLLHQLQDEMSEENPQTTLAHATPANNLAAARPIRSPMVKLVRAARVLCGEDSHALDASDLFTKLQQYSKVVQARLGDFIPMTVYYYLVTCFTQDVTTKLQYELTNDPSRPIEITSSEESSSEEEEEQEGKDSWLPPEKLLRESEELEDGRKMISNKLERVKKAERRLNRFSNEGKKQTLEVTQEEEKPDEYS